MSDLEICQLAYEGKLSEFKKALQTDNELLRKADSIGRVSLHWAACGGHDEMVQFILHIDSNVNQQDDSNWTPLMIAASAGKLTIETMKILLSHGADVNVANKTGQTALHYAASKNRYEIAELLLENGAVCNTGDWVTNTPLHRSASLGHTSITKLLLSYNADPNYKDIVGNTPLHLACEEERGADIKLLIQHEASLTLKNNDEKTSLDLASPHIRQQLRTIEI